MNDDSVKPKPLTTKQALDAAHAAKRAEHANTERLVRAGVRAVQEAESKVPSLGDMCPLNEEPDESKPQPPPKPETPYLDQATLEYVASWLKQRARRWRKNSGGFPIGDATRAIAYAELIVAAEDLLEGSEP